MATSSPRIFVSHSHQDDAFCRELVAALEQAGADVWYDQQNMGSGRLVPTIEQELRDRPVFVAILSPSAIESRWVEMEAQWAYTLQHADPSRTILPVLAAPMPEQDIWLFLQAFRRIEAPGMEPLSPRESASRMLQFLGFTSGPRPGSEPSVQGMPPSDTDDDFQVTAFHPKEAKVATWDNTLVAYAHVASAIEAVRSDAMRFKQELGEQVKEATSISTCPIPRGTQITLAPKMQGVQFDPEAVSFKWTEDWHRAMFRFRPDQNLAGDVAKGEIEVYATTDPGSLLISCVRLAMMFEETPTRPLAADARTYSGAEATSWRFHSVFASYAHEDTAIVQECCQSYQALGIRMHVDYRSLLSGQHFDPAIMQLIASSDIFQLYWSKHAACSEWVCKEWQYALSHDASEGFIRPLYWEEPMPDAPAELAHVHFARLERAAKE